MSKLKTIALIGASALSMNAVGVVSAQAQPFWGHRYEDRDYDRGRLTTAYVDSLEWRIRTAARNGYISWGEANSLRAQLREVQPLAWRVETGAATNWEYRRLDRVVTRIEAATSRYADNRRWRRW